MTSFLESIIANKKMEIRDLPDFNRRVKSLFANLIETNRNVVAEIKRRSPSVGRFSEISLSHQLNSYVSGGASAISVLTDHNFFSGSINDLKEVSSHLKKSSVPVLRKDFIVDLRQLYETKIAGADVVLLIVAVLGENLYEFIKVANQLGLEALVEVHNEKECEIALDSNLQMIAVNNRNLHDFKVSLDVSKRLIKRIPSYIPCISASGISTPDQIKDLQNIGYRGFLIGEALMTHENPKMLIRELI